MKTKNIVMDPSYIQEKVSRVRKSCVTAEHRAAYRKFYQLYKKKLEQYNTDFGYRFKVDMWMLTATSLIIATGVGIVVFILLTRLLNS